MGFKLDIEVPVNGRVRQATITALGEDGKVAFTDKADLVSMKERKKLAQRLADRLHADPGAVEEKLDAAWAAQVERRREAEVAEAGHAPAAHPPAQRPAAQPDVQLSELGNARRLVAAFGHNFRHCFPWNKDLVYDGRRWCEDDTAQAERWGKAVVRLIYAEAASEADDERRKAIVSHALRSEQAKVIRATVALARSEPGVPVTPSNLDTDPWLLNVRNGTLDLRTGQLLDARRADLITKLCAANYDPEATCPLFMRFLGMIFSGDAALIRYVQKLFGYALTGDTREQILTVFWGSGANGKSTLINLMLDLLGEDYAIKASRDLFMARKADSHPAQLARLFGKRLVVAVETADGERLDEALVKELTGGDPITARRMREDPWQFTPTHKAVLVTNHRPEIKGTDHAIWRRIRLVPFKVRIPDAEQDKDLLAKLRQELPGILAWCVAGCSMWQEEGLEPPEEVRAATEGYRAEQDVLGEFLAQCCDRQGELKVRASQLFSAYRSWCDRAAEHAVSQRRFGEAMTERG
ncbi:MAG TPA: phage/plasmid primase, P4 family, partial [Gemmataceae bacterium]|nr:phage/plasmid primase, P4 family [Gemmataceae bacterium]